MFSLLPVFSRDEPPSDAWLNGTQERQHGAMAETGSCGFTAPRRLTGGVRGGGRSAVHAWRKEAGRRCHGRNRLPEGGREAGNARVEQADRRRHGRNGLNPARSPLHFPPHLHSTAVTSSSPTLHSPRRAAHATQAAEVVGHEERVSRLAKALTAGAAVPLESRINAAIVVEAATSVLGAEARAVLGTADGVMEGLVVLVDEVSHAYAVRVGIQALFALFLALRPVARAWIHDAEAGGGLDAEADRRRAHMEEGGEANDGAHGRRLKRCVEGSGNCWRAVFFYVWDPRLFLPFLQVRGGDSLRYY
jgi:hypothetical protein